MFLVFKIIGGGLLICACFAYGCCMSKNLYMRRNFIKSFIVFLSALSTNIRYNSDDIFTLVSISARSKELSSLKIEDDNPNVPFGIIWEERIKSISKVYSLTKEDKELLIEFGSQLGKTDIDGQLKHIELYKAVFKKQLANSEEAIIKKSKLYKTMGFFVGTAAALMMI